jgi:exopolyphosphatase / guanosine-5'-triphosphate,3'-diphosphate pyrophosphatase
MGQFIATGPGRGVHPPLASSAPRFSRGRFPPRQTYAALDLGTNNCRMLIARPDGDGFFVVDAFSRIVRLGEGLGASGRLSDVAMDRAVSALRICADKLVRRNVQFARSVATEACRRASNGGEFIARVYRETGIKLDIISAEEEARLAVIGCHRLLGEGDGAALVFDIGGGSTELVLVDTSGDEPQTLAWRSVPWGVVSLSEAEGADAATEADRLALYDRMRVRVRESIASLTEGHAVGSLRLLGTSGTVTTLASVHLGLKHYDRKQVDGLIVPSEAMRAISADLSRRSVADRATLDCIGEERADLVVAGCAILDAILDIWPASAVGVADRGIREGILRQLIRLGDRR